MHLLLILTVNSLPTVDPLPPPSYGHNRKPRWKDGSKGIPHVKKASKLYSMSLNVNYLKYVNPPWWHGYFYLYQ